MTTIKWALVWLGETCSNTRLSSLSLEFKNHKKSYPMKPERPKLLLNPISAKVLHMLELNQLDKEEHLNNYVRILRIIESGT